MDITAATSQIHVRITDQLPGTVISDISSSIDPNQVDRIPVPVGRCEQICSVAAAPGSKHVGMFEKVHGFRPGPLLHPPDGVLLDAQGVFEEDAAEIEELHCAHNNTGWIVYGKAINGHLRGSS